jgi:hypothetical protein
MTKPMIRIHNTETDEVTDREMTAAEFKRYQSNQAEEIARQAEADAKETAKAAILDRIGLTADEAQLLLG